jgi:hypothetical protein
VKLFAGILTVAVCCQCLSGCASLEHDYRVIYSATCPVGTDAELRTRLQALGDGVADRLQTPRPKVYDTTMDSYSVLHAQFAAADQSGLQDIEITFESEHNTVESRSGSSMWDRADIAVWIRTYPNEENASVKHVRSIIEAELTRVGCGEWDFRHHVKLS